MSCFCCQVEGICQNFGQFGQAGFGATFVVDSFDFEALTEGTQYLNCPYMYIVCRVVVSIFKKQYN